MSRNPSPSVSNRQLQDLRRFMRQHEMVLGGEKVLVAVSGGIDSMALLDMIHRLAPVLSLTIGVAHYDHGLRENSPKDTSFVLEQAKIRGLKTYVGRGEVGRFAAENKLSIEEAARKARYTFLRRVAQKHRFNVVLTGHNANDNAETLLLNLLRGSGVKGLAAIPPVRSLAQGIVVARPLLEMERSEIDRYAAEMNVAWREDETNASPKFLRNRIRHELLPLLKQLNPGIVGTLNSTASIMLTLEQYLNETVKQAARRVVVDKNKEQIGLSVPQLKHFLPAMQSEILQRSISEAFESAPFPYNAIERVMGLIWKETGSKAEIGSGLAAMRDRDLINVRREPVVAAPVNKTFTPGESVEAGTVLLKTALIPRDQVRFTRNGNIEYVDADRLGEKLVLRNWKEGDRFRPLGMEGEKKVSDFLVDKKVPLDRKGSVLVLCNGEDVIWVCGMRLDDRYKVDANSTRALKLELGHPDGQ